MSNGPKKITQLPVATNFVSSDLLVIVQNTSTTPVTGSITTSNLLTGIVNFTANNTNYVGSVAAANVVSNATLQANLSGYANLSAPSFTANVTVENTVISNNSAVSTKINVGTAAGYDFTTTALIELDASQNTFAQIVIQNANSQLNASSDLVVTSDTGNNTQDYVDLGINSSTYSNALYTISGSNDGYLYSSNGNLAIGTAAAKSVIFHANGTLSTDEKMRIAANGNIGMGNTTPVDKLSITGSLAVSTNTFNLGSNVQAANGYNYLPNGVKMNWGWVSANSTTAGAVTFTGAYTTNAYIVLATSNTATATYQAAVVSWTKLGANIVTANATSTNVFWTAIGT
jgi:hypothetical protein